MPSPFDAEVIYTTNLFSLSEHNFYDIAAKFPTLVKRIHARGRAIFGDRWSSWEDESWKLHQTDNAEEGAGDFSFHGTLGRPHALDRMGSVGLMSQPSFANLLSRPSSSSVHIGSSSLAVHTVADASNRPSNQGTSNMTLSSCKENCPDDIARARNAMLGGAQSLYPTFYVLSRLLSRSLPIRSAQDSLLIHYQHRFLADKCCPGARAGESWAGEAPKGAPFTRTEGTRCKRMLQETR